jgi:hypothetical protein
MHPDALAQIRKLDREDLGVMLRVLHGAKKALKARDECGDPVIAGSRGAIRACNGTFSIFVKCCESRKRWNNIKRATAGFAVCTMDGDDEGVLRLTRLPEGEEIALVRKIVGIRQTLTMPSSAADRLNRPSSGPLGRPGSPTRAGGWETPGSDPVGPQQALTGASGPSGQERAP